MLSRACTIHAVIPPCIFHISQLSKSLFINACRENLEPAIYDSNVWSTPLVCPSRLSGTSTGEPRHIEGK